MGRTLKDSFWSASTNNSENLFFSVVLCKIIKKHTKTTDDFLRFLCHNRSSAQRLPSRKGDVSLSAINFLDKHCICGNKTILLIGTVHQPMLYFGNKTSPQNVVDAFCSNSIG